MVFQIDPFGGAQPRFLRRSKQAPLRVNPEPFGCTQGLELVEKHSQGLWFGELTIPSQVEGQAGESKG